MQILDLLCMFFDAVVGEFEKNLLLFRLAPAILWEEIKCTKAIEKLRSYCLIYILLMQG